MIDKQLREIMNSSFVAIVWLLQISLVLGGLFGRERFSDYPAISAAEKPASMKDLAAQTELSSKNRKRVNIEKNSANKEEKKSSKSWFSRLLTPSGSGFRNAGNTCYIGKHHT